MKEINLPITQTYISQSSDFNDLINSEVLKTYFSKDSIQFEIIRKNGGNILYATTSIEKQLEEIIFLYLFNDSGVKISKRNFFLNEFLESSDLTFKFKKEIFFKIINNTTLVGNKDKDKLQKYLKDIMTWRNVFAHGELQILEERGPIIKYYSSGNQVLEITDNYWDNVEVCYINTSNLLNNIIQKLRNSKA
jgi:hypothetical protein